MGASQATVDPDIATAYHGAASQAAPDQTAPLVTDDLRAAYNSADASKATPATPQQLAIARAMGHPDMTAAFNNSINNFKAGPVLAVGSEMIGTALNGLGAVNQTIENGEARVANAWNNNPIPPDQLARIKNLEFGDVQTARGESPFNAAVQGIVAAGVLNPLNMVGTAGEALGNATKIAGAGIGTGANYARKMLLTTLHMIGNRNASEAENLMSTRYKNVVPDVTSADIPALGKAANSSHNFLTSLGDIKNQAYQALKDTMGNETAQPQHVQQILQGVNDAAKGENPYHISKMMDEPIGMQDAPTVNKGGTSTTTLYKHNEVSGAPIPYRTIERTSNKATKGDITNINNTSAITDEHGVPLHSSSTEGQVVNGSTPNKIPYTVGDLLSDAASGTMPTAEQLNLAKQALTSHAPFGTPQSAVAGKMASAIGDVLPDISPSLAKANQINTQYKRAQTAMQTMFGDVTTDPLVGNQYTALGKTLGIMRTPLGDPLVMAPKVFDDAITQGHQLAGVTPPVSTLTDDIPGIAAAHTMGRWLPYLQGESLAGGAIYAGKELAPGAEGFLKSLLPLVTLGGSPKIAAALGKTLYGQQGWQQSLSRMAARGAVLAKTPMGRWISGAGADVVNKTTRQAIMRQLGGQNDQTQSTQQ